MKKIVCALYFLFLTPFSAFSVSINFSYESLAKMVLETYPEVQKSLYDVDIAISEEISAKNSEYPVLSLNLYGFPIMMNVHYNEKRNITFDFSDWKPALGGKISLTVPVYSFGRISNIKSASLLNRLAKEQDVLLTQAGVKQKVKELYWGYLSYNSFKKYIFDVILPQMEKNINEKETDFEEGKISRSSLENSKMDFLDIKLSQLELNRQKSRLNGLLAGLTNRNQLETLNIQFKVKYLYSAETELKAFEHYLNIAHKEHPALKKGEFLARANDHYSEYEKALTKPMIGFGLSGGYNYFDFKYPVGGDRFFPNNGPFFTIGFSIDWNISWWENSNKNQRAETNKLKNLQDVKLVMNMFESQLKNSYDNLIYQQERLNYLSQIVQIAQRNSIFTSNAKKTGVSSDSDLFNSLKDLFYKLKNYYQQLLNFNMALASFEEALGQDIVNYNSIELKQVENELFTITQEKEDE